jgi:predicted nucleic acid-binding protein
MKYVLDASVAVKWVITEADSDKADLLRADFQNGVHELIAPDIFPVEVGHALTRGERQGRVPVGTSDSLLGDVLTTVPHIYPTAPLLIRAVQISSAMKVGVYDCIYIALAEGEKCELITADDKLVKNLQKTFPFIVDLKSLP